MEAIRAEVTAGAGCGLSRPYFSARARKKVHSVRVQHASQLTQQANVMDVTAIKGREKSSTHASSSGP